MRRDSFLAPHLDAMSRRLGLNSLSVQFRYQQRWFWYNHHQHCPLYSVCVTDRQGPSRNRGKRQWTTTKLNDRATMCHAAVRTAPPRVRHYTKHHFRETNKNQEQQHRVHAPPPLDTSATTDGSNRGNTPNANSKSSSVRSDLLQNWINQLQSPPNLLTLCRIAATPLLSYWVVTHQTVPAMIGCSLAALSDAADGYLARRYRHMATTLGTYLDPLADKLLINALSVSLWINGTLPTPLIGLWLAKDVTLMVATYWYVSTQTAKGLTVWDPVTTPLQVNPTTISKINTGLQFATLALGIAHPVVVEMATTATLAASPDGATNMAILWSTLSGPALPALYWLTGATTILSVGSYAVGRSAFSKVKK